MDFIQNFLDEILKGIDKEKLSLEDKNELRKFRENLSVYMQKVFAENGEDKKKIVKAMRAGSFALIAQIPVVTPVITAVLEIITSEDLGEKMDIMIDLQKQTVELQKQTIQSIDTKFDTMIELQKQTIELQKQTTELQKQTIELQKQTIQSIDTKFDTMINLQKQTTELQKQTIELQKQTIDILEERLPEK